MAFSSNAKQVNAQIKKDIRAIQGKLKEARQIAFFRIGNEMRNKAVGLAPRKSGQLRRSIQIFPNSVFAMKDRVQVGSNLKYARIQDFGGTITPKSGQYLTIPLGGIRGGPRNYPGGFFIRSKAGNLLYVVKTGKTGIKPLFVLKKSVTLRGKPYLRKAFGIIVRGRGAKILDEEFARVELSA